MSLLKVDKIPIVKQQWNSTIGEDEDFWMVSMNEFNLCAFQ